MSIAVAIDGPSGAGKSTISQAVAKAVGFLYVDTGALYRAVGYYMLREGVDVHNPLAVTAALAAIEVTLKHEQNAQQVFLCGENVTEHIRTQEVSAAASAVSAHGAVRDFLFESQRNIARENNVIMDGRDIGTVVLPQAQIKIYLTAKPEERARRRLLQLAEKGIQSDFAVVLEQVNKRDYDDMHRAIAPLKQAEDAVYLDTTQMDFAQVVGTITQMIETYQKQTEGKKQ